MNRRNFLAFAALFVADPERLLWRPGARLISIPKPLVITAENLPLHFACGDIITFSGYFPGRFVVVSVYPGQLTFGREGGQRWQK